MAKTAHYLDVYRYAYFHHLPQVDLPYVKIPLHTVIKLTPKAYGCDEERFVLDFVFGVET
jgi:hypothetical protein